MDPIFSLEYNELLKRIDNIRRRINSTREKGSNDPELKGCTFSDALEHSHQRLRTIYLERLREATRHKKICELPAAPTDLAGPSETTPSPDVDKAELECLTSLESTSLENNHLRRIAPIDREVSWKGNLEAVCIIPGRHDANVSGSTFTKRGLELVGTLRRFRSKSLVPTTPINNAMESSGITAAASHSGAKLAKGDSCRRQSVG